MIAAAAFAIAALSAKPAVDFRNFTYPALDCSVNDMRPKRVPLRDGEYSWSQPNGDSGLDFLFREVASGDLRSDGSTQSAVLIGCEYPDPGFFEQFILVYDVRGARAALIAQIKGGDEDGPVHEMTIRGHRLYVDRGLNTDGCARNCMNNEVTTYALVHSKLTPVARREYVAKQ